METQKVYKFEDVKKLHKKLQKLGKIYSEQWIVKYNTLQTNGFWKNKEVMYCTETKGMSEEVEKQWEKDYKNKNTSLISIHYQ